MRETDSLRMDWLWVMIAKVSRARRVRLWSTGLLVIALMSRCFDVGHGHVCWRQGVVLVELTCFVRVRLCALEVLVPYCTKV
jgi:hypothetical protein